MYINYIQTLLSFFAFFLSLQIESGGVTLRSQLQKSNPTETPGCDDEECLGCSTEKGKGGKCRRNNINYVMECQMCPEGNRPVYIGDTSRNLFTRCKEHMGSSRNVDDAESSFIRKHMVESHGGREGKFEARVTHTNKDSLTRQIREGVLIRRAGGNVMNTKSEWFQPPLFRVRSQIVREQVLCRQIARYRMYMNMCLHMDRVICYYIYVWMLDMGCICIHTDSSMCWYVTLYLY